MAISLKEGFKTPIAVVDWVSFVVELRRNSHGGHIKRAYEDLGVSHALPLDKGAGGAAAVFEIRLQHPTSYASVEILLAELDATYGLASVPKLCELEVSIDFYHQTADISALQAMTERLMVSVSPATINSPRIIGEKWDFSRSLFPPRSAIASTKTLYIGDIGDDAMWRVYWKRFDDTFAGEDGKRMPKQIDPSEYRARVEVRLKGKLLEQLGLVSVTDLNNFSYERLHSIGLFKFARRDLTTGPIFTNLWAISAGRSFGIDDESPACVLNGSGRRGSRGRMTKLSRHLITDIELTEASRHSLRRLSQRFSR